MPDMSVSVGQHIMLSPERHGELEFATVDVDRLDEAIESMKSTLPGEERTCEECGYVAETHRWGIKTYGTSYSGQSALVLCCPACETHVDLPLDLE